MSASAGGKWYGYKRFAAKTLARLCKGHEATQSAIGKGRAIAPLVALLDGSQGWEAQEEAAGALFALAELEHNRLLITQAGGISPLVRLLASENGQARMHAEGALVRLSLEDANRVQIIKKLVDMLQQTESSSANRPTPTPPATDGSRPIPGGAGKADGDAPAAPGPAGSPARQDASSSFHAQEMAAAALANLARESEDNRKSIVDADGIPPLLDLLESPSAKAKENSVGAITELCRKAKDNQAAIAKVGGIPKIVSVLLGYSSTSKEHAHITLCTLAAEAVKEMARDNKKNQDAISEAGAIPPLAAMLASQSPSMQAFAAGALAHLARGHADNQHAIAKTGAVAPLCTLVREGSEDAKDSSAAAVWSLATDNAPNKDMIAKLGGIDPLIGLLVTGETSKSQANTSGALCALAAKHVDNRALIAKRLVGLLSSSQAKVVERAVRVLSTCSAFASDSTANQIAITKTGGVAPLISWLEMDTPQPGTPDAQASAAQALLCLVIDNAMTQVAIAKGGGIAPLIALVKSSSAQAQNYAARALWHLATVQENQLMIAEQGGIRPLVAMLASEGKGLEDAAELAASVLVRLGRNAVTVETLATIADKGAIVPLVKLLKDGSPGAQLQSAAVLAELALLPRNRDVVASAGGIQALISLLSSPTLGAPGTPGTAELAARTLAHISLKDDDLGSAQTAPKEDEVDGGVPGGSPPGVSPQRGLQPSTGGSPGGSPGGSVHGGSHGGSRGASPGGVRVGGDAAAASKKKNAGKADAGDDDNVGLDGLAHRVQGSDERRAMCHAHGGVRRLITMIDGSHWTGVQSAVVRSIGIPAEGVTIGMVEQAAAALADMALADLQMQNAIIDEGAVPCLLAFIRSGSPLGQEHAARAIRNLMEDFDNRKADGELRSLVAATSSPA